MPPRLLTKNIWRERFEDIRNFERYLSRNGGLVLKFFLHLSKKEQKRRFLSRLEEKEKNWKFSLADAQERGYWKQYQAAYEDAIRNSATPHAPWYVVPPTTVVHAARRRRGDRRGDDEAEERVHTKLGRRDSCAELAKARAALLRE